MLCMLSTLNLKTQGTDAVVVATQAIASRLEDPEHHTTPPIVEQVKDKVLQDHAAKASTTASGESTAQKAADAQNKHTGASSTRQVIDVRWRTCHLVVAVLVAAASILACCYSVVWQHNM